MIMIDPTPGLFGIFEIRMFGLDDVMAGNDEYIDRSSARVSQLFNNMWLCRYPHPRRVLFDNGSTLLKDFNIILVSMSVKNPQANAPVERVHQVILNILFTKDIDNRVFYHIDPWGGTLASIAWEIRASHKCTTMVTPGQTVFGGDMLLNLTSVIDWRVVTAAK